VRLVGRQGALNEDILIPFLGLGYLLALIQIVSHSLKLRV
jgi:hypothetical protein